ncbi:amidase signature enzyme [Calocera viscosa TUFC12733]|uniref:Glutamyl-tRNA(Gln) amidotransferase subunit A, mitochondrial n=1 Tax=Calocera viscosa (strain TUFC12733) TaxID=1330018 RepID=A0A167SFC9_CALVF|nr:amidase signature enzyme [Calocera viscosa TUFC12733]
MRRRPPPLRLSRRTYATTRPAQTAAKYLERIRLDQGPEGLNAFVSVNYDLPPEVPGADGTPEPRLCIAVKDNICTSTLPTTAGSLALSNFNPPYSATILHLLLQSGAHILGKTNMDSFGMGSFGVHSSSGPVRNPRDRARVAGGSSSGSAAAVAGGLCDVALGTDTGGSTRLPASYCGTYGLKPSYGLLSRHGIISYADSLDTVGLLARSLPVLSRTFQILNQHDPRDPTSAPEDVRQAVAGAARERLRRLGDGVKGLRVGVPAEYCPSELSPQALRPLRNALRTLRRMGAELVPVSLPSTRYALSAYYVLASAEASSNLARYDGVRYGFRAPAAGEGERGDAAQGYARTRTRAFGEEVKKRLLLGTYALTAERLTEGSAFDNYFLQAQLVRKLVKRDFDAVFSAPNVLSSLPAENPTGVDLLLHPSAIGPAPLFSQLAEQDSLDAYVQDVLSVPASLAGVPALSVPVSSQGMDRGEEEEVEGCVGVSVVGQWGWDELVMRVGEVTGDKGDH